jgi:rubrerythrin
MELRAPIKGPGGVLHWPKPGPDEDHDNPGPRETPTERRLRRKLRTERLYRVEAERQIHALKVALAAALGSPHADRWKAVICEICGCMCKPREDCPMCLWGQYETEIDKTINKTKDNAA